MKRWVSSILLLCLAVLCFAQGDVFRVVSITDLGDGRLDVKLYNERTHYIHSETISIDIGWAIGDLINIIVDSQGRRSFKKVGQAVDRRDPADARGSAGDAGCV
jgi:hypothetical protein